MSLAGPSNYQVLRMEKSDKDNPQSIGIEGKQFLLIILRVYTLQILQQMQPL